MVWLYSLNDGILTCVNLLFQSTSEKKTDDDGIESYIQTQSPIKETLEGERVVPY